VIFRGVVSVVQDPCLVHSPGFTGVHMLQSHKRALANIKSAQQRIAKATEERDKLKAKLQKAQARLAAEKRFLRENQERLES